MKLTIATLSAAVLASTALAAATVPASATTTSSKSLINDQFGSLTSGSTWTDGQTLGRWQVVFAGYGAVSKPATRPHVLRLSPTRAQSAGETHAALVVSRKSFANRCLDVKTRVIVREQLRVGSAPTPWETAWLIWDYLDNEHFSYLAIKTNGWELGKRDPAYPGGQRFLATGEAPATAAGQWRAARIKRTASADGLRSTIRAFVGGVNVATFRDTEWPYVSGRLGMYVEDATADFDKIVAKRC